MPNIRVTVYQQNTYFVEADNEDKAEQWVQENESWLGRDQENHYESYFETEIIEEVD
tara:strand:+ start:1717 stop:1887 length:171 start_codon:yes stop_codon:yes gene_type:complete